jgi:ABC-type antimicrobial peptide transport system permease subunit
MNDKTNRPAPPGWTLRLLRFFLRNEFLEEIEGDLAEIFEENLEQYSIRKTKRLYNKEVMKLIRPALVRKLSGNQKLNYYGMLQHNFTLTFRSYMRYKSAFLINLIGLSTGLACTLLIYLWVNSEFQMNKFHEKGDRLYEILVNNSTSTGIQTDRSTPALLPQKLAETMPEVEYATTESWLSEYTLSHNETNIKAVGQYAGEDYFHIFSYELLQGDKDNVLQDKSAVVISDELAIKLFGTTTDVVGKTIDFMHLKQFQVSGIFKSPPASSTHQFDFIMTFGEFKESRSWILDWKNVAPSTFVVLREGTDLDEFNAKIENIIRDNNGEPNMTPFAMRFRDLYLNGKFENGKPTGSKATSVNLIGLIAFFILAIACINFMNLSTARVSRRVKEIGIKKAVGASRRTLIFQFMSESIITTFLSLIVALSMVWLALPEFNSITDKSLSLTFSRELVLTTIMVLLVTGILSGSYPALYLSGFKPVNILKGQVPSSWRELFMRKGLVVFQFVLSTILIVSVLVIQKQIEFTQQKHPGFNKDNIVLFEADGELELKIDAFLTELKQVPGVTGASSTAHSIAGGRYGGTTFDMKWTGKESDEKVAMEYMRVNHDFIELLDFQILQGRSFSNEFKTDIGKVILNEQAVKAMGLEDPVGQIVKWGTDRQVLGVVKDFHFRSFHTKVGPAFFVLKPDDTWVVMAKLAKGNEQATLKGIQALYEDFNPGFTFDYEFMEDSYTAQYGNERRTATLSEYFAGMAIIISCLGLFGLVSFTTERRIKEIGIRKILGSGTVSIVKLLSGDFTRIVGLAILIALPVSYYITADWLQSFEYRVSLHWWFFAGAGGLGLVIAWLTVAFQTIKAATVNPVQCLRDE